MVCISFDLFVLGDMNTPDPTEKWVEILAREGIDCMLREGFAFGKGIADGATIGIRLRPPLVPVATEFDGYKFYLEPTGKSSRVVPRSSAKTRLPTFPFGRREIRRCG